MRTFFISDLHYGVSPAGDASVRRLAEKICGESRHDDILIIGGDIAVDDWTFEGCLWLFHRFRGKRMGIPGNHDIWVESGDDSVARFHRLSRIFALHGFHRLDEKPVVIDGTAFVGSMGWYDYSFRDDIGIDLEWYRAKVYPDAQTVRWSDAAYVRWGFSDEEVTDRMLALLKDQMDSISGADRVIATMHHVPTKGLLVHPRWMVPKRWRFLNAFLGSERFGDLLSERTRKVQTVLCGHIHRKAQVRLGDTTFLSNGGDYAEKAGILLEGTKITRFTTT